MPCNPGPGIPEVCMRMAEQAEQAAALGMTLEQFKEQLAAKEAEAENQVPSLDTLHPTRSLETLPPHASPYTLRPTPKTLHP